jgi:hypothetical protein
MPGLSGGETPRSPGVSGEYEPHRRARRRPRRATIELEAYERWTCPKGCGKVYRKNSTVSIRKHVPYCHGPPVTMMHHPPMGQPMYHAGGAYGVPHMHTYLPLMPDSLPYAPSLPLMSHMPMHPHSMDPRHLPYPTHPPIQQPGAPYPGYAHPHQGYMATAPPPMHMAMPPLPHPTMYHQQPPLHPMSGQQQQQQSPMYPMQHSPPSHSVTPPQQAQYPSPPQQAQYPSPYGSPLPMLQPMHPAYLAQVQLPPPVAQARSMMPQQHQFNLQLNQSPVLAPAPTPLQHPNSNGTAAVAAVATGQTTPRLQPVTPTSSAFTAIKRQSL